jgi:predicted GIY-YIG superfamily endonuclease
MPFYVYIVRCSDASYYTGHSDDLEKRISDHNIGGLSAYVRKRRPAKLVFAEEFYTREEALARERQLQGWSRAKKEALIAGNWTASASSAAALPRSGAPPRRRGLRLRCTQRPPVPARCFDERSTNGRPECVPIGVPPAATFTPHPNARRLISSSPPAAV